VALSAREEHEGSLLESQGSSSPSWLARNSVCRRFNRREHGRAKARSTRLASHKLSIKPRTSLIAAATAKAIATPTRKPPWDRTAPAKR
jgi:hypothetical protein